MRPADPALAVWSTWVTKPQQQRKRDDDDKGDEDKGGDRANGRLRLPKSAMAHVRRFG